MKLTCPALSGSKNRARAIERRRKKVVSVEGGEREVGKRSEKQVCTLCLAVDGTVMHGEENKRFTRLGRNF